MSEARTITDAVTQEPFRVTLGGTVYEMPPPSIARNLQARQACAGVAVPISQLLLAGVGKDDIIGRLLPFMLAEGVDFGLDLVKCCTNGHIPPEAFDEATDEELARTAMAGVRATYPFLRSMFEEMGKMMEEMNMMSGGTSSPSSTATTKRKRGGRKASTK